MPDMTGIFPLPFLAVDVLRVAADFALPGLTWPYKSCSGTVWSSVKPISSKCDKSARMASASENEEEWKDDDFDDLELESSGGEPGS